MLKVALVGCGKVADSHVSQIRRIAECEIVGVCDQEELMARQLRERFSIKRHYNSLAGLLEGVRPDVVHITTSPQSHFPLARQCLEAGCHVYVEKPFTVHATEADTLLRLADKKHLRITAGHDDQFSPVARRMRDLIRDGYLGGPPLHMECYYGYELGGNYARALLGDRNHWIRKLPGQLLHNIISHGIARIAEYIRSDSPSVIAHGFTSPFLRSLGETRIVDELRMILSDGEQCTAYFTFSTQMRPIVHQFRVFGAKNGLVLDEDEQVVITLRGKRFKSYAEKFLPPFRYAGQYFANAARNARLFVSNDFHMKSGMKFLFESFYRSIREESPTPIPYREILLTARIMDEIFAQLDARNRGAESVVSRALKAPIQA